ncbi:MAG: GTP-binding protein [Cyclobacteriaceae bacterium]
MANILAIVGRPNVGKSTLFNRLIESKEAIMDDESGVTRDRHYGVGEWNGKQYTVIDTGGYVVGSDDIFEYAIRKQVKAALSEATVILYMVDAHEGIHPLDQEFAIVLRELNKPLIIAANKSDNPARAMNAHEFHNLGMDAEVMAISSVSGFGTGDLLDEIVQYFEDEVIPEEDDLPKIAILGRPNVGKSSFLNALIGVDRSIVTDIAGTTRDVVNTRYNLFGKDFFLTDTAGIRKKSKVHEDIEFYSVLRALQALQDSDICIIMIDAARGLESQDVNLLALADKYKKGAIIMINKWDLMTKETNTVRDITKQIHDKLGPLAYSPIIFCSVLNKQRIFQVIEKALEIYDNRSRKIATSKLNEVMQAEIEHYPPPAVRSKYIKIKYITQLPTKSPTFAFFCNYPKDVKEPYTRFLVNKLRSHFDLEGVPVKVVMRKK